MGAFTPLRRCVRICEMDRNDHTTECDGGRAARGPVLLAHACSVCVRSLRPLTLSAHPLEARGLLPDGLAPAHGFFQDSRGMFQ